MKNCSFGSDLFIIAASPWEGVEKYDRESKYTDRIRMHAYGERRNVIKTLVDPVESTVREYSDRFLTSHYYG